MGILIFERRDKNWNDTESLFSFGSQSPGSLPSKPDALMLKPLDKGGISLLPQLAQDDHGVPAKMRIALFEGVDNNREGAFSQSS